MQLQFVVVTHGSAHRKLRKIRYACCDKLFSLLLEQLLNVVSELLVELFSNFSFFS